MNSNCLTLSLPAVPESVRTARMSVGRTAARLGASDRLVDDIRLCVSEAVSNVVRHAYGTPRGDVDVRVEHDNGDLEVLVRDDGRGMKRERQEARTSGGYGLKIIDSVAAGLTITSAPDAGTEVRMTFSLVGTLHASPVPAIPAGGAAWAGCSARETMFPREPPSFGCPLDTLPAERHGPGGPAGLQNQCGRVTHGSVGSTPAPLRHELSPAGR